MVARKRDVGVTWKEQVETFRVGRRVRNKGCGAIKSWERQRELSQSPVVSWAGSQRMVSAVIESHPAVAPDKHVVLQASAGTTYTHMVSDAVGRLVGRSCKNIVRTFADRTNTESKLIVVYSGRHVATFRPSAGGD